jgi:methionyl-tRNA formyltransferase
MMNIVMMGTGTFAEPTLEALLSASDPVVGVFTQPDRDSGVKRGSTRQVGKGMKNIAAEKGIPVFQPEDINTPEGVSLLAALCPDVLVVAAYGQILSNDILSVPGMGGINVHGSLLPKYRGAAPVAWAIYRGETQTGVTIIRMSPSLDGGDMLAKGIIDILPDETAGELESRLAPLGARLALEVLEKMKQGPVSGEKQDLTQVTKARKLKKEDGLIAWGRSAEQVCRQIRAMQPWPTAYTFLHREAKEPIRMIIRSAHVVSGSPSGEQPPGAIDVAASRAGKLIVQCGENTMVEIVELQPAGKSMMASKVYLRGYIPKEGDRFG